ncbi:MAG: glycosyltransferase family 2 protein [Candidatus Nanopelagicales bacterium]
MTRARERRRRGRDRRRCAEDLKVGVVVPLYNGSRHILETLGSLDAQSHANLMVVVCDDGSSDGSYELAVRFAEAARHRFLVVRHQANQGILEALVTCLDGLDDDVDAVAFLAHDDLLPAEYIGQLAGTLQRSGAMWVQACMTCIDASGAPQPGRNAPAPFRALGGLGVAVQLGRQAVSGPGHMVRREALSADVLRSSQVQWHDWETYIRLAIKGDIVTCLSTQSYYRLNLPGSLSTEASLETTLRDEEAMWRSLRDDGVLRDYFASFGRRRRRIAVRLAVASKLTSVYPAGIRGMLHAVQSSSRDAAQASGPRMPRHGLARPGLWATGDASSDPRPRRERWMAIGRHSRWVARTTVALPMNLGLGWREAGRLLRTPAA